MNTSILVRKVAALAVVSLLGSPPASAQFLPSPIVPDARDPSSAELIRDALRDAFNQDPDVPSARINIIVMDDKIVLFGTVTDIDTRDAVVRRARAVAVRPVFAKIKVGDGDSEVIETSLTKVTPSRARSAADGFALSEPKPTQ